MYTLVCLFGIYVCIYGKSFDDEFGPLIFKYGIL